MSCARKPVNLPYVNLGCQPRMLKYSKFNKRIHYSLSVHLSLSIQQMCVVYRWCVKYYVEHMNEDEYDTIFLESWQPDFLASNFWPQLPP